MGCFAALCLHSADKYFSFVLPFLEANTSAQLLLAPQVGGSGLGAPEERMELRTVKHTSLAASQRAVPCHCIYCNTCISMEQVAGGTTCRVQMRGGGKTAGAAAAASSCPALALACRHSTLPLLWSAQWYVAVRREQQVCRKVEGNRGGRGWAMKAREAAHSHLCSSCCHHAGQAQAAPVHLLTI